MGVYLSKPVQDKDSSNCQNAQLKCGASSMQGWRVNQEDAHNCCLDFDEELSFFAVYDGHGGHEVAQYASQELPDFIKCLESYKQRDLEKALKESFLGFDETLKNNEVVEKLKKIAKESKGKSGSGGSDDEESDVEEDESDVQKLKAEANMPLTEVFAKYTRIHRSQASLQSLNLGETSKSPFLRAKTSSSTDAEVSSSSVQNEPETVNGVAESNGEISTSKNTSEEKDVEAGQNEVTSSFQNGEVVDSTSPDKVTNDKSENPTSAGNNSVSTTDTQNPKGERISKKKAAQNFHKALLEGFESSDTEDSDDTSFKTSDFIVSSEEEDEDEEGKMNGDKCFVEEEEVGEEEIEEEEDEEDEEEDEDFVDYLKGREDNSFNQPGMDSGCTAVVALVTKDKVYVANAGDSRAVLCRDGNAFDLSIDHKPEDVPEMKRIKAAGGKITYDGRVNGGLNLSRALGDHLYKRVPELDATEQMITALPDIRVEVIKPEDEFLVLACDGIWNSMTSQEVVDFVKPLIAKEEKLSTICEMLFEKCLAPNTLGDGAGCDNMTCVIVQFLNKKKTEEKPADNADKQQDQSLKRNVDEATEEVDTTVTQSTKKPRVDLT